MYNTISQYDMRPSLQRQRDTTTRTALSAPPMYSVYTTSQLCNSNAQFISVACLLVPQVSKPPSLAQISLGVNFFSAD